MENSASEQNQPENAVGQASHRADFSPRKKWTMAAVIVLAVLVVGFIFWAGLSPVNSAGGKVTITVVHGQGFFETARALDTAHLLRSRFLFEAAALISGKAFHVQSGTYQLSPAMSGIAILGKLSAGASAVTVTVAEGSNLYVIDKELADAGVIGRGDLIDFNLKSDINLEGRLFPDTYQFFEGADISSVVQKFLDNFNEKAAPILAADPKHVENNLTLASVIEREAPDPKDESIIAGIILKRIAAGERLQIDATVCYAEQVTMPSTVVDCAALTRVDFTTASPYDSDYNTYLHAGLPPGPIGNPGIAAITAAMHPASSSYWYYISDPATGKIVYAATLAEQEANIKKYLSD